MPTSDSATLFVDVEVVALRAGTHTIGIGLEGRNGGVIISGGIGSVFQGRFTWTGALAGLISPVPCDSMFVVEIGGDVNPPTITPTVTAGLYTHGSTFSLADRLWIRADGNLHGRSLSIRSVQCQQSQFTVIQPPSGGITRVEVKVEDWNIIIDNNPGTVRIDRDDVAGWDDGWRIQASSGAWGTVLGQVEKGVKIPIRAEIRGADIFTAHWKAEYPWLRIGAHFQYPGNSAHVNVLNHFDFDIIQQTNGIVEYRNPLAGDRLVPAGTCQGAYFGALLECAATTWF